MSKINEIEKLLSDKIKEAPDMTHALKKIGDGDMKQGLENLFDISKRNGEHKGVKKGLFIGGGILSGVFALREVYGLVKRYKKNKAEEQKFLEKLEEYEKGIKENIEIEGSEAAENEKGED